MIAVNGSELYYEDSGSGSPPLFFIHGTTGGTSLWAEQVERLSPGFRCVTYDRRGNNRSPLGNPPARSIEQEADDAAGLIRALNLAPCVLVGVSFGGLIGTDVARRYPELLSGAVLCEPPIVALNSAAAEEFIAAVQPKMNAAIAAGGPSAAVDAFISMAAPQMWACFDEQRRELSRANHAGLFGDFEMMQYRIGPDDLRKLRMPCLILAGTDSAPFLRGVADVLAKNVPNAELVEIQGSGHVPFVEKPDETADAVRAFARRVATRVAQPS